MEIDLIDVFGGGLLSGNPLAVVRGAERLDAVQMLALTRWIGFFGNHVRVTADRSRRGLSGAQLSPFA